VNRDTRKLIKRLCAQSVHQTEAGGPPVSHNRVVMVMMMVVMVVVVGHTDTVAAFTSCSLDSCFFIGRLGYNP